MRRWEALAALAFGLLAATAGVTWLFGGWGLLGAGVGIGAAGVALIDFKEE